MGRIAPDLAVQDAVVPRSALPECWTGSARSATATASASATSSTRATATCIPTSASTAAIRTLARPGARGQPGDHGGLRRGRRQHHRRARRGLRQARLHAADLRRRDARRDVRGAPGVRSRGARQSRQGGPDARLPRVARDARGPAPMSDVDPHAGCARCSAPAASSATPTGCPRAVPDSADALVAGLPAGARGGLEGPGRGPGHLAAARRAGRPRGQHPRRWTRCVSVSPADLVATVQAGTPLEALRRRLADDGMWLALDPPGPPERSLGSIVATAHRGPAPPRLRPGARPRAGLHRRRPATAGSSRPAAGW